MVRKLVLAVAAASALMSSGAVFALGVGDINLRSALNQPLDAEIELLQVGDLSSQEVISSLATPDEFGRAGIERIFFLNDLTFTPVVRPDGKSVIRVTSSRPVREPFLNFLMEVRWPSGRVLREFTLLLDPPLYDPGPAVGAGPISQPVIQPRTTPQVQPPVRPTAPAPAPAPVRPAAPTAASTVDAAPASPLYQDEPVAQSTGDIRTTRADTLWEIALRHRPQGASVHQTMLAIQDLNPDAFIGENINRLRAEQRLTLPDAAQATGRSQAEAISEVAAQNASWQQGRQTAEPAERQLDARRLEEASPAPQSTSNGDSLRLVGSGEEQDEGGADAGSRNGEGKLRDELDTTKEELDSVRREKAEAESRLADMQSQMETLQRLLELKDEQLATMQQAMGDAAEAPEVAVDDAAAVTGDAAIEEPTSEPVAEAAPVEEPEAQQIPDTTEIAQADVPPPDAVEPEAQPEPEPAIEPETAPPVEEPVAVAPEEPAAETDTMGLLQRMMQNQTFLLVGGGVILLLLLLLLMAIARRNARRETDLADNFIAQAAQNNDAPAETDQFNVALADPGEKETDQGVADPIVEADALIAYGKLGKAADVLTAAIENEPERTDLRLKLMEVNGLLDDAEGYAEQEAVLRRDGSVDNQIDMLNVRFPAMAAALASSAVAADEYPEWDEDFLQEAGTSESLAPDTTLTDKPVEPEADPDEFDFSGFDAEVEPAARQEPVAEENLEEFDLDFDLDEGLAESLAQTEKPKADTAAAEDDFDFDFSLDEPVADAPAEVAPAPQEEEEFTLDEDFDLSLTEDLEVEPAAPAQPDTELQPLEEEQTLDLSDDELEAFEAELNAGSEAPSEDEELDDSLLASADEEMQKTDPAEAATETDDEDEDEFDFLSGTDESATKLDLARAYIDMGDNEGARDILSEVIEEGNEQQQQEARDMMGQLD